jgi:hypothetical protein
MVAAYKGISHSLSTRMNGGTSDRLHDVVAEQTSIYLKLAIHERGVNDSQQANEAKL